MTDFFQYYKELAKSSASDTEKVGRFAQQQDSERYVFPDLLTKLPNLSHSHSRVIDIGCGCSEPVRNLIANGVSLQQNMVLIDSDEMLDRVEDAAGVIKCPLRFPDADFCSEYAGWADVVITYSVFHYVFGNDDFVRFVDEAVRLLAPGGALLVGDLANATKKKRFLATEAGARFHQQWSGCNQPPQVNWNTFEPGILDDQVVMFLMQRYRTMGFETYLYPQHPLAPFAHTREDLVVWRRP